MKARWVAALAAIFTSLLAATIMSTPANAAVNSLFQSEAALTLCAQEIGAMSGVFLDPCDATQSSDLWSAPILGQTAEIINNHSHLCLSANNSTGVVDMEACAGRIGQDWKSINGGVFGGQLFQDISGTGFYLWQSSKSLVVLAAHDPTSSHDSWFFTQVA
jgi:hypothetical protein